MSTDETQEAVSIDGPVYPMLEPTSVEGIYGLQFRGITKREYFAAMAMQGLLANAHYVEGLEDDFPDEQAHQEEHVALRSVIFADALLAALEASK